MKIRKLFALTALSLAMSTAWADSVMLWGPWEGLPQEPTAAGNIHRSIALPNLEVRRIPVTNTNTPAKEIREEAGPKRERPPIEG